MFWLRVPVDQQTDANRHNAVCERTSRLTRLYGSLSLRNVTGSSSKKLYKVAYTAYTNFTKYTMYV